MDNKALQFRKAADRVWEMAEEYEEKGMRELATAMKELSQQLHDLAREKGNHTANGGNTDNLT